jgi:hypothetical protein
LISEHYGAVDPSHEGTTELWFDTLDDFRFGWNSPELQEEQMTDSSKFLKTGPFLFVGREILLK